MEEKLMKNNYKFYNDYVVIYANCKGETMEILIDKDDFDKVNEFSGTWYVKKDGNTHYARIRNGNSNIKLHRVIMNYYGSKVIDHRNGNGLDNRKNNLRIVTQKVNSRNRKLSKNNKSGVTGVCYNKLRNKWEAQIKANGRTRYLGLFDELQEAKEMRKVGEIVYWNIIERQRNR
jgi:HNH endonuclease/AP2 domain